MNDQENKQKQPQQGNKQNEPNTKSRNQGGDIGEGEIEHPDQQPDKKVTIDDNPDETQRKVPNMTSKY